MTEVECDNCGATMKYDSKLKGYICYYCGNFYPVSEEDKDD